MSRFAWTCAIAFSALAISPSGVLAQGVVERGAGGSIRTDLGSGIVLNKQSNLNREWIVVKDPTLPVGFAGSPGITTTYGARDYYYTAKFQIAVSEDITALEILFVCFDVWGQPTRTLSMTKIADYAPGQHTLDGRWQLFSENEASEHYASIAYVSRIRTATGRVIEANRTKVVEEGRRLYSKFTDQNALPADEKK